MKQILLIGGASLVLGMTAVIALWGAPSIGSVCAAVLIAVVVTGLVTGLVSVCNESPTPTLQANKTRGALLGFVAAATIAVLQTNDPITPGCCHLPTPWFMDYTSQLHTLVLTFMAAMPFAVLAGVLLGVIADALPFTIVIRFLALGLSGFTLSAFPLLLIPELARYGMPTSLGFALVLTLITKESTAPVPTADRDADP